MGSHKTHLDERALYELVRDAFRDGRTDRESPGQYATDTVGEDGDFHLPGSQALWCQRCRDWLAEHTLTLDGTTLPVGTRRVT